MTTKEILTEAQSLVKKGWTQGANARNAEGNRVYTDDPNACQFCAGGALIAVSPTTALYRSAARVLRVVIETQFWNDKNVPEFNDASETTQSDVISAFDEAIKRCENDG